MDCRVKPGNDDRDGCVGSVVHGMLIEGTMETMSKAALCALVLAAAIKVMAELRVWRKRETLRAESIARQ